MDTTGSLIEKLQTTITPPIFGRGWRVVVEVYYRRPHPMWGQWWKESEREFGSDEAGARAWAIAEADRLMPGSESATTAAA